MKRLIFLAALLLGCGAAHGQIVASTCSAADVQTALNLATNSTTTVTIPSGTCTWTAADSFTVPSGSTSLTIQGSSSISGTCGPSGSCTATDSTIIIDNYASTNPLLTVTTNSNCTLTRITGITFKGGTGSVKQGGVVSVDGTCHSFRFDHNHMFLSTSALANIGLRWNGWVYGVADHNLCDMTATSTSECFNEWGAGYGGNGLGDGAWAATTQLGTANFLYLENNVQNNGLYFDDCDDSGRAVVRFNQLNGAETQTHPTGSAPNAIRGCRAKETYQNQFNGSSACDGSAGFNNCLYNGMFLSAGTGVMWGNSFPFAGSNTWSSYQWVFSIQSMRISNSTYTQTATPNGWGYCGTAFNGTGSAWDENTPSSTGYACMDQPGQGQSDLLQNDFPSTINTVTSSISWPHQALEPYYEWGDIQTPIPSNPGGIFTNGSSTVLVQNRDFYIGNASFDGTTGVGSGVLASRPGTCTTGVAYWATDQGSWNTSGGGGQGVLYKCTSTNTWTSFYTPYSYPHPLISGVAATSYVQLGGGIVSNATTQ